MPRGKRKTCLEKLSELQEAIRDLEEQLKNLKSQEKELLKEKKEEELRQIADVLDANNLTASDLVDLLRDLTTPKNV